MLKTIMFANQKGGVGKTTSVLEIGYILSKMDKNILIIDFDSQCNLTESLGNVELKEKQTIYDTLMGNIAFKDAIIEVRENLDLLPGSRKMLSQYFVGTDDMFVLKEAIPYINEYKEYDYILIDVGPEGGQLMTMALLASDYVIAVTTLSKLSYSGIVQMCADIKKGRQHYGSNFSVMPLGILITSVRKNNVSSYERDNLKELSKEFGANLFKTEIKHSCIMDECKEMGEAINEYKPGHIISLEYQEIAEEIIERTR